MRKNGGKGRGQWEIIRGTKWVHGDSRNSLGGDHGGGLEY